MRSWSSLITGTLIPPTRVYRDANGNFAGTSTNITSAMLLFGRIAAWLYFLKLILFPILAPFYLLAVNWYCKKFDAVNLKDDPKGWPIKKKKLLRKYTSYFIIWCAWMLYGYLHDWGANDLGYEYTQPVTNTTPGPVYDYDGRKIWDPEWQN